MKIRDEHGVMRMEVTGEQAQAILKKFKGVWKPRTTKSGTSPAFYIQDCYVWEHSGFKVFSGLVTFSARINS